MSFSLFSLLFLIITIPLFFLARGQVRIFVLLAASFAFCWFQDPRALIFLLLCTAVVYFAGLLEDTLKHKKTNSKKNLTTSAAAAQTGAASDTMKVSTAETTEQTGAAGDIPQNHEGSHRAANAIMAVTVILLILLLILYKCAFPILRDNLLFSLIPDAVAATHATNALITLYFSVGISYYIFQSVGYLADVAAGKIRAEINPFLFALYLCYFPKFLSGPIERPQNLLPQFRKLKEVNLFDASRWGSAFYMLLYGYMLKVLAADRLTPYRETIFMNPQVHSWPVLLIGVLLYTMEIYCDFAGYSAIAIGISRIFGIELSANFSSPYCSANITEFWRRWHMSLSSWLRDYIYIPLGGNRKGQFRRYCNVMAVFIVCGLWHGFSWNFLVWGLLHGIYSVVGTIFRTLRKEKVSGIRNSSNASSASETAGTQEPHSSNRNPGKGNTLFKDFFSRCITFIAVSFAWIFFGMKSLPAALDYIGKMFSGYNGYASDQAALGIAYEGFFGDLARETAAIGIRGLDLIILVAVLLLVILTDIISYRRRTPFPELWQRVPYVPRYLISAALVLCILVFGIYGPGYNAGSFMYMAF